MTDSQTPDPQDLSPQDLSPQDLVDRVSRGYAAEATPPLTDELLDNLRAALKSLGLDRLDHAGVERINQALDAFELDLGAVVGPRLETVAPDGRLAFRHRSEAGRPLRAYGGQ